MKFPGKRILLLLAVPAVLGLAFATADSGVFYQSDGKSSSCSAKKSASGCCSAKAQGLKASASCGSIKKAGALCGTKSAAAAKCNYGSEQACTMKAVQTENGLRIYVLGDSDSIHGWMETVATKLAVDHDLKAEVFKGKDGCYLEFAGTSGNAVYADLLKDCTSGGNGCEVLCKTAGCPPKV